MGARRAYAYFEQIENGNGHRKTPASKNDPAMIRGRSGAAQQSPARRMLYSGYGFPRPSRHAIITELFLVIKRRELPQDVRTHYPA
ncbi:uncharacterized protein AruCF_1038 [Achromobacter ruhlandii]|nr:uncharacterized protein AruCF_1038 [Achromobacter ruhlandii]